MNTHNKTPQKKLLMISFTSLLCNSAYSHAANQENIDEIKRQQLRAPINTEQVSAINSHTGRIGASTVDAITGGTGTNLAIIETNLQIAAGQLSTTLGDIEGVGFDTTTDSLHAISDAVASITSVSNITSLGGSGTNGQQADVSYIYSDFASLGQTSGDVSNLNVRLTAIDDAIANIPDTNLSALEGPDYSTANNSLAALAGTGALPNGSGSTNTFDPARNSLADIAGDGFATADNSLVAISQAIANIPATDLAPIEGAGFDTATDSLAAISDAIANIPATDLAPIEGGTNLDPFNTATDSLYAISNNLISIPFATQAQVTTLGNSALATSVQAANILTAVNTTIPADIIAATNSSSTLGTGILYIEGESLGFTTTRNSLASICGTGYSGSTNIFSPATNSLADIAGGGFATADNSLVAISAAIANIPATDLAPIEGAGFDTATDSLAAISDAIANIPATDISTLATILQVNNLGTTSDTSGLYTDIVALGTAGDISNLNTRLNTLDLAINALPTDADIDLLATSAQSVDILTALGTSGIQGSGFDTATDSLAAISDAIANIPTTSLALLGSSGTGQNADPSFIYADLHSLGAGVTDVSSISSQFDTVNSAIDELPTNTALSDALTAQTGDLQGTDNTQTLTTLATAIDNIPATDLTPIEGPDYSTANNSLAALAGTGALPNGSGSTNTFDPATQSLADMAGAGFDTATDSLAAISDAIANIPATDISTLATILQVNDLGTASDTSGIYTQFTNLQKSLAFIVAQLIGDPIVTVDQAAAYEPLTTAVTVSNADSTVAYQNAINAALAAAATAIATATQTSANTQAAIDALVIAITEFNALANTLAGDGGYVTSGYSAAEINAGLAQLNTGLAYLLLNQVA